MGDCPFHYDHENRIKNLEEANKAKVSPAIWVGLFSFLATVFATVGSLIGVILNAYLK